MAFHDPLTGLPNRRLFEKQLHKSLEKARWNKQIVGIMYLDLDRFKFINDSLGHRTGDILLQEVAKRLQGCLREEDMVSRQGGDEFTILLQKVTEQEATEVAQKILDDLTKEIIVEGHEIFITPSIGITFYPLHGLSAETLLKKADMAMYQAKKQGRNNYQLYNLLLDTTSYEKFVMETDLRKALDRNEFVLHYQPQVNLYTNQVLGAEALIRWDHPRFGLISPNEFIPLAEEIGIITAIGEWVIREACYQNKLWLEANLPPLTISINLSMRQFYQANLIHMISKILEETGMAPQYLEIEITESMAMDIEVTTTVLNELKNLGVQIAIDDFGTGFSSLNYLKNFPLDRLKIDQSFIRDITTNTNDKNIVITIISMAHNLNLKVIAEGVETEEQLSFLKDNCCDEAQGYLFSKPMPAEKFVKVIKTL